MTSDCSCPRSGISSFLTTNLIARSLVLDLLVAEGLSKGGTKAGVSHLNHLKIKINMVWLGVGVMPDRMISARWDRMASRPMDSG